MEDLYCQRCQIDVTEPFIERVEIKNTASGFHLKASCSQCGQYLKFLPHGPQALYFGKYKGKTLTEVVVLDPNYLRWLLTAKQAGPNLKRKIEEALKESNGTHTERN